MNNLANRPAPINYMYNSILVQFLFLLHFAYDTSAMVVFVKIQLIESKVRKVQVFLLIYWPRQICLIFCLFCRVFVSTIKTTLPALTCTRLLYLVIMQYFLLFLFAFSFNINVLLKKNSKQKLPNLQFEYFLIIKNFL